ncbi:site-2 protease family protein [Gordonia sp. ABSL11-1]|uniref:site-2 protease family protein n=1 Tax=Gordonia sp. ABSL11-1 TaxID=3053924 RepID=UPI00257277B8|nr:site-2 protease family protein [Gordonia sp. ABSL11-1]MDL9945327.1 site-2 protease family protein [Gordonia sp. ABSL11-1]
MTATPLRPSTREILRAIRPGPLFLGLVAAAVVGGWIVAGSEPGRNLESVGGTLLLVLAGWVISLCLHEFAHAVTAFRFGDRNAELRGYLTLNPLRYTHPGLSIGLPLLIILLGGIGFPGGAVYVDQHGFTRAQRTIVSLAGPFTNAVLAAILLAVVRFASPESFGAQQGWGGVLYVSDGFNLWAALSMLAFLQITAAVLNLLPVPGFDGYGAIEPYLSDKTRFSMEKIAPYGFLIVFALLFIPFLNRAFFDLVYWLFGLSGVTSALASYGWDLFVFWR